MGGGVAYWNLGAAWSTTGRLHRRWATERVREPNTGTSGSGGSGERQPQAASQYQTCLKGDREQRATPGEGKGGWQLNGGALG